MNCLRSSEYIKKIDNKYKKYGLETMLIHPPEWDFEKEKKNIVANLKQNNINFPFIADGERKKIAEFGINFWPTQILVRQGKVVYKHIGEGNYKELENEIIDILEIKNLSLKKLFNKEPKYSKHPTVYCGKRKKGKIDYLINMNEGKLDFGIIYTPEEWEQKEEYLQSMEDKQSLTIVTRGEIINFVAESLTKKPIKVAIQLNNKFIKNLTIERPQLYKLIELKTDRPEKLTLVTEKNLAIYSFSFQ